MLAAATVIGPGSADVVLGELDGDGDRDLLSNREYLTRSEPTWTCRLGSRGRIGIFVGGI